jgi:hypothetical protein
MPFPNPFSAGITIFLTFSSEQATPTLPMQMQNHIELTSLSQFQISVKPVTTKNLQNLTIPLNQTIFELFTTNIFTITAISCEV